MKQLLFPFILIILISCSKTKESEFFDVKNLKGYSPAQLEVQLGTPDTTYTRSIFSTKFYVMQYENRDTEFRFTNEELNAIVINKPFDLEFSPQLIELYGFKFVEPHEKDTSSFYRWKNLEGIKNVNIYKVGMKRPEGIETYFKIYFDLK